MFFPTLARQKARREACTFPISRKGLGYDLDKIEDRVCEIFRIEKGTVFSRSRVKEKADARAVFCFWVVRELGYGLRELGRKLGMTQPGVGYAVSRGETISKLNHYLLKR